MSLKNGIKNISNGLSTIAQGMGKIFGFNYNKNSTTKLKLKTFKDDANALKSDWEAVYNDIETVTRKKE